MDWFVIFGTGSLGLVVGWLVWTFVDQAKTLTIAALGSLASIITGGGVLAVWKHTDTGGLTSEANTFFVGLALSVIILGLVHGKFPEPVDK